VYLATDYRKAEMACKQKDNRVIYLSALIVSAVIIFSWFALRQLDHGLYDGFDQAVYRQIICSTLQGKFLWCSFIGVNGSIDLMAHTNLTLLLLLPVFKFFNSPGAFLVIYAFFLGIAALPVYWIAREKINSRSGFLFAVLYLINTFTVQSLIEGFQTRSLSVPLFFFAFYLLIKKRYSWFNLMLIMLCLTHEINCLLVFMLGIYVIFVYRRVRHGLIISFLSLGWFIFVIKVLFIHFGNAFPLEALSFIVGGKKLSNAGQIISYCFLHPIEIAQGAFSQANLDYLLRLFLPLGFLSLASPLELLIGLPIFLQNLILSQRLIYVEVPRYTMSLLPLIFISAIYSAAYLSRRLKSRWKYVELFVVLCWSLSVNRFIRDPEYNPRLKQVLSPIAQEIIVHREALKRIIRLVPRDASVSADLKAMPLLADRLKLYDIPLHITETEYVLIDKKEPRISPKTEAVREEYPKIVEQLLISTDYVMMANLDGIILLKKVK
jgi:uncharacterized membrane protein